MPLWLIQFNKVNDVVNASYITPAYYKANQNVSHFYHLQCSVLEV